MIKIVRYILRFLINTESGIRGENLCKEILKGDINLSWKTIREHIPRFAKIMPI